MTIEDLDISSFFSLWEQYPGLIPVSINKDKVIWQDVGRYHFYEGFFHKSLNNLVALSKRPTIAFSTGIEVLQYDKLTEESLIPSGFIFHIGRCGSTILTKVLGSTRENHIVSEAVPLNLVFSILTNNGTITLDPTKENQAIYKNLLLALARKRVDTHQNFFVKFSSYNVYFIEFIQTVFPNVPVVFITRDTEAVVASFQRKPSAWMHENYFTEIRKVFGIQEDELPGIIEGFKKQAKKALIQQIDYNMLKPENLLHICSQFNYTPRGSDIIRMQNQFLYDSKVEFNKKQFEH